MAVIWIGIAAFVVFLLVMGWALCVGLAQIEREDERE